MRARVLAAVPLLVCAAPAAAASRPAAFDPGALTPYFTAGSAAAAAARFRAGDYRSAAARFVAYLAQEPRAPDRPQAEFLLALALMRSGQWDQAAATFRRLVASYPLLATYHAFFAARCALQSNHAEQALADLGRVPDDGSLADDALLLRADALAALGRKEEARAAYAAYLERFPGTPDETRARFRLAGLLDELGRPATEVLPLYRRIYLEAPLDPLAAAAEARIKQLGAKLPPELRRRLLTYDAAELVRRGNGFFARHDYTTAEKVFIRALGVSGLTYAQVCEARYLRAQAAFRRRPRTRAAPLFERALEPCARARDQETHAKTLYQAARAYAAKGDERSLRRALDLYARVEQEHRRHSYADDARLRQAEILADLGEEAAADKLLEGVVARYPRGDMLGEALWRLAWHAWRAGRMVDVRRWTRETLRRIPRETEWYAEGRALYWAARADQRDGKRGRARRGYERTIRTYPLSYYALLSFLRLESLQPARAAKLQQELRPAGTPPPWHFARRPVFRDAAFQRGIELLRLGLGASARRELAESGVKAPAQRGAPPPRDRDEEELGWLAALLYDRAGQWAVSHSIARNYLTSYKLEYPRGAAWNHWRIAYPRAYSGIITESAAQAGIPAPLLWAIAREESAFNPGIVSYAQAVGLTQLLVSTARRFAPPGLEVTRARLFDPAVNARIGAGFLAFLWKLWGGNPGLVVASYNAGENAVGRWMKERGDWSLDEFIEAIPYEQTRGYTKRVLASYFAYSWLDDGTVPRLPLK